MAALPWAAGAVGDVPERIEVFTTAKKVWCVVTHTLAPTLPPAAACSAACSALAGGMSMSDRCISASLAHARAD